MLFKTLSDVIDIIAVGSCPKFLSRLSNTSSCIVNTMDWAKWFNRDWIRWIRKKTNEKLFLAFSRSASLLF